MITEINSGDAGRDDVFSEPDRLFLMRYITHDSLGFIIDYGNRITTRARQVNPGYTLLNGFVSYNFRTGEKGKYRHSLRLNGLNLADKYYWTVTGREAVGLQIRGSYSLSF